MKIGEKIFVYSPSNRNYETYEEHLARCWVECEIVAETRVSWIVKLGVLSEVNIDKKTERCRDTPRIAKSTDEIRKHWEAEKWLDARYRMGDRLRSIHNIDVLHKVADLIGFDPFDDK